MGRRRTTGCTARHFSGEPCAACQATRATRCRQRRRDREAAAAAAAKRTARRGKPPPPPVVEPEADPARVELDAAAARHRVAGAAARAYVAVYRSRGLILPPATCERCRIGERLTPWGRVTPLVPWHPDPARPREVAWLCASCRRHVRATREALTLTWVWPGGLPARPRGRPPQDASSIIAIMPTWRDAGEAAAARSSLAGLADDLFLHAFLNAAGVANVEALYLEGVRASAAWRPLGDSARDAVLREWIEQERVRRSSLERIVEPVSAWERRPRRDRHPSSPPPMASEGQATQTPSNPAQQTSIMAEAMERLAAAEAAADAALERVTRALKGFRPVPGG